MNAKDGQNSFDQNPALSVSRLKYKLAKLQLALKDKDAELSKLKSSTKATAIHEMRLQTQVYYDEIVRLLQQMNVMQDAQSFNKHNSTFEEKDETHQDISTIEKKNTSKREAKLLNSIETLKRRNHSLEEELKKVQENVMNHPSVTESLSLTNECKDPEPPVVTLNAPSSDISKEYITKLTEHINLLLAQQKEWEGEKSAYREMLASLEKDRLLYMQISENKNSEVLDLREGLQKLKEEIQSLNTGISSLPQQMSSPVCHSCPPKKYLENSSQTQNSSGAISLSEPAVPPSTKKSPRTDRKSRRTSRKEASSYLKKPLLAKRPSLTSEENSSPENHPNSSDTGETHADSAHDRFLGGKRKSSSQSSEPHSGHQTESKKQIPESQVGASDKSTLSQEKCTKKIHENSSFSAGDRTNEPPAMTSIADLTRKRESDVQLDEAIAETLISANKKQNREQSKAILKNILDGHVTRTETLKSLKNEDLEETSKQTLSTQNKQLQIEKLKDILEGHMTRVETLAKLTENSSDLL